MTPGTSNPTNIVGYNFDTNSYYIPTASANGPGPAVEAEFREGGEGGTRGLIYNKGDNWLTFAGFYYLYKGSLQGETISFMAFEDVSGWPLHLLKMHHE